MSKDAALEFLRKVADDEALATTMRAAIEGKADRPAAIAKFAAQRGHEFSAPELAEALNSQQGADQELGEEDLAKVAGGMGQSSSGGVLSSAQKSTSNPVGAIKSMAPPCFLGSVEVTLDDGTLKRFEDVRVGDVLEGGSRVYATLQFDGSGTRIYDYEGVYVAGDHFVCEDGRWTKVESSSKAVLTDEKADILWDLLTTDQRIRVKGCVFWDYEDDVCEELAVRDERPTGLSPRAM